MHSWKEFYSSRHQIRERFAFENPRKVGLGHVLQNRWLWIRPVDRRRGCQDPLRHLEIHGSWNYQQFLLRNFRWYLGFGSVVLLHAFRRVPFQRSRHESRNYEKMHAIFQFIELSPKEIKTERNHPRFGEFFQRNFCPRQQKANDFFGDHQASTLQGLWTRIQGERKLLQKTWKERGIRQGWNRLGGRLRALKRHGSWGWHPCRLTKKEEREQRIETPRKGTGRDLVLSAKDILFEGMRHLAVRQLQSFFEIRVTTCCQVLLDQGRTLLLWPAFEIAVE